MRCPAHQASVCPQVHCPVASVLRSTLVCFLLVLVSWPLYSIAHDTALTSQLSHKYSSENMIEDQDKEYSYKPHFHRHRTRNLVTSNVSLGYSTHYQYLNQDSQQGFRKEWNFTQVNLANSHLFLIRSKYSCSVPRAKLVKVLDVHSSTSKQYVPR